ncbi:hypothetical protein EC9_53790 [Rosistilla ulvae]|uniref:Thioredoxin domain-containing protein n=1 Tax=Rosistilla ulvae TaxID=1930277 RepID=A0A517M8G1_9BACT|nr:hypothetical protein [Rosistilla ulvae]QDS91159.1 hypothetical protein EC9_53790 [Rosistilla ulvae]
MTRNVTKFALTLTLIATCIAQSSTARGASPVEQMLDTVANNQQFAYILFYRNNDAATQSMHGVLQSTFAERRDAAILPVQITDVAERDLVKRFDATRLPMPAVAVLAPNGAVCSVFPQRVTGHQLTSAIVSPGQAKCLKALQDKKIVLLCAQPAAGAAIPMGVRQFMADSLYQDRSTVVTVEANDPGEAKFLNQLKVRTDQPTSVVAFMAPPGVMIGIFNGSVTHSTLAEKLAAAGKCCDDENCKHHKSAGASQPARR